MRRKKPKAPKHMIARARTLRQESSFPERLLWSRLRNGQCGGFKFRRQHPIGPYVADFFCDSSGVVVELDGRSHDDQDEYDNKRQNYLERQGLRVIRFSNDCLLENLDSVVETIAEECSRRNIGE